MSNTPVPVSIAGDVTWGVTLHTIALSDMSAPMDWWGGVPQHALSRSPAVVHKGQAIVLEGHSQGLLLPHWPEDPLALMNSSRKPIWSASTVRANGKAIGCASKSPARPMHVCGFPFKLPSGINDTNSFHSVYVGMSEADFFRGCVVIGAELIKDTIGLILFSPNDLGDALGGFSGYKGIDGASVDAIVDLAASYVVSWHSGWEEPIELKYTVGGPVTNLSVDIKWKPDGPPTVISIPYMPPVLSPSMVSEGGVEIGTPIGKGRLRHSEANGPNVGGEWVQL